MPDMRRMVESTPEQLSWAAELEAPPVPQATEAVVCGMGGSAVSGDYLGVLAAEGGRRVVTHRGYGLPGWCRSARPLVLAISYSGDTEETLSSVAEADGLGLEVVVVSGGGQLAELARDREWPLVLVPGGLQPRAALGHLLGAAVRLAGGAGILPGVIDDLQEASAVTGSLVAGGSGWRLAEDVAEGLEGRVVGVYATAGLTEPVAGRWRTQVNENAKRPAWASLLPELDHNEIMAWRGDPVISRGVGLVALRDSGERPEVARRFRVTREVTERDVSWVAEVWSQGDSLLARLLSLTLVGDMTSVAMAERGGTDPLPVEVIELLKERLREER